MAGGRRKASDAELANPRDGGGQKRRRLQATKASQKKVGLGKEAAEAAKAAALEPSPSLVVMEHLGDLNALKRAALLYVIWGYVIIREASLLVLCQMDQATRDGVAGYAGPIFDHHVHARGAAGSATADKVLLLPRTARGQRRQLVYQHRRAGRVTPMPADVLAKVSGWGGKLTEAVLDVTRKLDKAAGGSGELHIGASTVLVNRLPLRNRGVRQQLHTDSKPSCHAFPPPVAIMALEEFKLYVSPCSHDLIRKVALLVRADSLGVGALSQCDVRLERLLPGDLVIMNGNCVHAGYKPMPMQRTFRAHWYMQRTTKGAPKDETYNLEADLEHYLKGHFTWAKANEQERGYSLLGLAGGGGGAVEEDEAVEKHRLALLEEHEKEQDLQTHQVGLGVGGIQHFSPLQPHQPSSAPLQQRAQLAWLCLPSNLTNIFLPPLQHDQP